MLRKMFVLVLMICVSGLVFAGGGQAAPGSSGGGASSQPAPSAEAEKIGSSLIGKLEGPEFILDPARFPRSFNEAPALTAEVRAGRLPELSKRLPEASELLVVKPLHEIGKYGGNWRRAFTGPADHENGNRICANDKPLTFDYTGTKIMPCLLKSWEVTNGGKTIVVNLRKGARWSDGQPFTADDFVF
ncbi:MAG: ABC transporter substrate-binding protein, partial [Treponema sp.]|nr:ABC transporter substrate-binding protein [Treponema sp.]